jgi:hypothetical protein
MSTVRPIAILHSYHVASLRIGRVEVKLIFPNRFQFPKTRGSSESIMTLHGLNYSKQKIYCSPMASRKALRPTQFSISHLWWIFDLPHLLPMSTGVFGTNQASYFVSLAKYATHPCPKGRYVPDLKISGA